MVRYATFGDILRDARIRKGMDLPTAAHRLRVRGDLLRSLEEGDFARLPARGYTKSIVAGYARLVGLDPARLTQLYLDEVYAYEVGRVQEGMQRDRRQRDAQPRPDVSQRSASRRYSHQANNPRRTYGLREEEPLRGSRRTEQRHADPRGARQRQQHNRGGSPQQDRARGGIPLPLPAVGRSLSQPSVHSARGQALPTRSSHYTSLVASPKNVSHSSVSPKASFVVAALAILLVLALLIVFVFGRGEDQPSEELPSVPVSGLTDTSTPTADESDPSVPTPPTSTEFGYRLVEGQSAYVEIYVDGSDRPVEAATVEGPAAKRYEVTGKLKFVTTSPSNISITVDGVAVEPADDDGNGVYTYEVDFASILAAWQVANAPAEEPEVAEDGEATSEGDAA